MIRLSVLFACLFGIFASCSNVNQGKSKNGNGEVVELSEARFFTMEKSGSAFRLLSYANQNQQDIIQEIVLDFGNDKQSTSQNHFHKKPQRVVAISTTYIPYLEALGQNSSIQGLSNTNLVFSKEIRERVEQGQIVDVGSDYNLNFELILSLQPDLVLMYDFGQATSSVKSRLEKLGLPVVQISEFRELTPLGKAEWIKFFGALFGEYERSVAIYDEIEHEYSALLNKASSFTTKPTVFTGLPWKGQWYQPGGKSFQAAFFNHAGADYLWKNDRHTSGIEIDREIVIDKALEADFWLHPNNAKELNEITDQDERYAYFKSFKEGKVFNNNARLNEDQGNDYWESAILKPHVVLKDLISIFHPEVFPNHRRYYYRKLN